MALIARIDRTTAGRVLMYLLTGFCFCKLPATTAAGWPETWESVLAYGAAQHYQWGRDLVFNYGPLGYLVTDVFYGHAFWAVWAWALGFAVVMSRFTTRLLERCEVWVRLLFCLVVPWLTVPRNSDLGVDALGFYAVTIIGIALVVPGEKRVWRLLGVAVLSVLALIKFTFLLYGGLVILLVAMAAGWRRDWRDLALWPLVYAAMLLLAWFLAGQAWSGLPGWLKTSWDCAAGYSANMTLEPAIGVLLTAIMVGLGLLWLVWQCRPTGWASVRWQPAMPLLILGAGIFLAWKEGLVRADVHVAVFFTYAILVALTLPGMTLLAVELKRVPYRLALAITCLSAALGLGQVPNHFIPTAVTDMGSRLVDTGLAVLWPTGYKNATENLLTVLQTMTVSTNLAGTVQTHSLDALYWDQDIPVLGGYHYQPRPVFQNYAAYSPALQALNTGFYTSPTAPEFVLWRYQCFDDRYPTLEDGRLLLEVLAHYAPVTNQDKLILWQRQADRPAYTLSAPRTMTVTNHDWFAVPAQPTWLQVQLTTTWWGSGRQFVYHAKIPRLEVKLANGTIKTYGLPPGFAAAGFLLNPLLAEADQLGIPLLPAVPPLRVVQARVVADDWSFQPVIPLAWRTVSGIPQLDQAFADTVKQPAP